MRTLSVLLTIWLALTIFNLIACFEKPPTIWRQKESVHTGRHDFVDYRHWDTVVILYTGKPLNVEAVELRCSYIGCPIRDTFYIINY